jgi:hypothetical protein
VYCAGHDDRLAVMTPKLPLRRNAERYARRRSGAPAHRRLPPTPAQLSASDNCRAANANRGPSHQHRAEPRGRPRASNADRTCPAWASNGNRARLRLGASGGEHRGAEPDQPAPRELAHLEHHGLLGRLELGRLA